MNAVVIAVDRVKRDTHSAEQLDCERQNQRRADQARSSGGRMRTWWIWPATGLGAVAFLVVLANAGEPTPQTPEGKARATYRACMQEMNRTASNVTRENVAQMCDFMREQFRTTYGREP